MGESKFDVVDGILNKYDNNKSYLIAGLQEIQNEYKYLPEEVLEYVAQKLGINLSKIFSVATFYENFSLIPKGKYIIKVCDGTACHVRKSIPILTAMRKELVLSESKHTTDDMLFTVETVSCLGACGLAPVITINDKVYPKMTPESTIEIIKSLRGEE
ncbi:MAG: complex I 24 kDa subunit family protein [Ruminiclostridium sp.]